ncbi:ABC transporter permease [Legionella qingyii]|uniref:ABC transporter permease n=1 Tax=Legionella qingyii TaxID=2184757 RepID=A0A317U3H5_9GAMM|nr:ABC transporter permease [Legionella qingyii]PWY55775.1 ABC transporter permease [Legionella qingyii]PWY56111.1 ABC transporter permease [Legionella qingyii]RUR23129.1 FtsX-like permease family protein [Legionella qingyii]RUR26974.1 FtsX-like permease family protein [Legionella qingyii]
MNFSGHCQQALVNLTAAKLRSFLAVLGILVGTAAVVALISCGQLATEKALAQFKALGTDLLAIAVYPKTTDKSSGSMESISAAQWEQMSERIPYIIDMAPYSTAYQPLSFQGKLMQGAVIGANEHLLKIVHIKLAAGHFVSFVESYEHYCVIGAGLARQIKEISFDDPIGKQLRIGQSLYTIIGVAKPWKENGFFNEDINQAAIVPLAGIGLISKEAKVNNVVLELKPDSPIDEVIEEIKQIVGSIAPKLSVFTRSAKQIIASMENQGQIFTLLLAVIGGISLLVGGIGVMNVMLVSVSERRKEIGIRKAVGAKNSEIQALFLVESVMLSLVGGVLGVILGLICTRILAYFSDWNFSIYLLPPVAGFLVSAATGIFFGFYPARRAAKLEPVVSLRSE